MLSFRTSLLFKSCWDSDLSNIIFSVLFSLLLLFLICFLFYFILFLFLYIFNILNKIKIKKGGGGYVLFIGWILSGA